MGELEHQRDRRRFKQNFQLAERAERMLEIQRKELGLPVHPTGSKRWNISVFRPNQARD